MKDEENISLDIEKKIKINFSLKQKIGSLDFYVNLWWKHGYSSGSSSWYPEDGFSDKVSLRFFFSDEEIKNISKKCANIWADSRYRKETIIRECKGYSCCADGRPAANKYLEQLYESIDIEKTYVDKG